jgi:hypothetical protein
MYATSYAGEGGMLCRPINAKGIDMVIYSQDGVKKHTIQTKSLSSPVPLRSIRIACLQII